MFELKKKCVMTIAAPRGSGKSHLIGAMLERGMFDDYDHIVIMSPSLDFNEDYDKFRNKKKYRFISNVTSNVIEKLFDSMAACMKRIIQKKREGKETLECPLTLLILDDVIDSGVIKFGGIVDKIAERGRHVNIGFIGATQRLSAMSRSVRLNTDYFIIFTPFSVSELEQYLEQFVSRSFRKEMRLAINDIFSSDDYKFVLLDNTERMVSKRLKWSDCDSFIQGKVYPFEIAEVDAEPLNKTYDRK